MTKKYERIEKYVYRNHHKYYIVCRKKTLGIFNTIEEAVHYKQKLLQDGTIVPTRRGRKPRCEEDRYIRRQKGKYMLQKSINGKT